jgi:hypothetical protein
MSIQNLYPNVKPSLLLDFANTKQLDPRITFTRASTATYYDGKTVAKAEENLFLNSNGPLSLVLNGATFDAGTQSITFSAATQSTYKVIGPQSIASGVVFTVSVFVSGSGEIRLFGLSGGGSVLGAATTITLTATPTRYTITRTNNFTGVNSGLQINGASDNSTATVKIEKMQFEQRSTVTAYTPTTTQPITNYIPVLLTAAAGVPRFEHNPVTGESLGLEIEEQRTNLLLQSEAFDTANWVVSASSLTVSANATLAPSGATTADKIIPASGVSVNGTSTYFYQLVSKAASATTYTVTCYAKADEYNRFRVLVNDNATSVNFTVVTWSLVDGSVIEAATASGTFTAASAGTAVDVGNGWYRCALTFTSSTETTLRVRLHARNSVAVDGDGVSGIYIWGAQLEAGAFVTSYIPTVASQVTRAADSASMTGTNFSSWYNQTEGTLYVESASFGINSVNQAAVPVSISDGTISNVIRLAHAANTRFNVNVNGVSVVSLVNGYTNGQMIKQAAAYKTNNFGYSLDGAAAQTDTDGVLPAVNLMGIGDWVSGRSNNGPIARIAYYPKRLTNAELQAITI